MKVLCRVGKSVMYAVPEDIYTYGLGAVVSGLMRTVDIPTAWAFDTEGIEIAQEISLVEKVSAVLKSLSATHKAEMYAAMDEFSNLGTCSASDALQNGIEHLTDALDSGDIEALDDMYLKAINE